MSGRRGGYLSAVVPEKLSSVVDDLLVGQVAVGLLLAHVEHLPQRHSEGPHVTGSGELALRDTRQHVRNGRLLLLTIDNATDTDTTAIDSHS